MNRRLFFLAFSFTLLWTANCYAQEATRWRGPEANGIYPDKGLLQSWPAEGPEILWTYENLGQGHSSPVISGNNIYITGQKPDDHHF